MSDTFSAVASQSFFGRLMESSAAAVFGLLLFLLAIGILVWNEGRAVDGLRGLGPAAKDATEARPSPIDAAQNGKLVHLTGALGTSVPLRDESMGLTRGNLVRLKRTVEMYQWKESDASTSNTSVGGSESTAKRYAYTKRWSEAPIDSDHFKRAFRHENPSMPIRTEVFTARDATLGDRTVAPVLLGEMDTFESIQPPPIAPGTYRREGDIFYKGRSPGSPEIGDIRITFSAVPVQIVSVLAEQRGARLTPFLTSSGSAIGFVSGGDKSADEMLARTRVQEKTVTWVLRAAGFAIFFVSLLLLSSPLAALGNVIPVVASLTGGSMSVFALGLAVPLTLATIALSWVGVRPVFGVGLLAVAGLCVIGYRQLRPHATGVAVLLGRAPA